MAVSQGQAAEHRPIPQPAERFLTSNLTDIHFTESLPDLVRLSAIYGPIYQLHLLDQHTVFLSSHEQVDHACDGGKFEKAFGDAPIWSLAHRILFPAIGPLAIRKMQPMMVDVISQMLLHWEHHAGQPFEAAEQYTNLTFDTIAWCTFKYRFNSFHSATPHPFISTMASLLKESSARAKRPGILKKLMFMSDAEYTRNIQALLKQCDEIIEARCKYPDPDAHDSLNNMFLDRDPSTGEALSDENIRYQMVTFLITGHETTSGLLSFATYFMLKNPVILRKAREEAENVIGESGGDMMKMNANKLKYIDAILKETLR
ncbi:cytochrome P450, partial [Tilletiaria anomala UBC 951]